MLGYTLRLKTERLCSYITAGFILHNVAKYLQDPDDFDPINEDEAPFCPAPPNDAQVVRRSGQQRRDAIAQELLVR